MTDKLARMLRLTTPRKPQSAARCVLSLKAQTFTYWTAQGLTAASHGLMLPCTVANDCREFHSQHAAWSHPAMNSGSHSMLRPGLPTFRALSHAEMCLRGCADLQSLVHCLDQICLCWGFFDATICSCCDSPKWFMMSFTTAVWQEVTCF